MIDQQHRHRDELGRVDGASVPADEIQIHEANGWAVVELLPDGCAFMAAPAEFTERRRA